LFCVWYELTFRVYLKSTIQEAGLQNLTTVALIRGKASPCGIYGGQSGVGTDFSWSSLLFPCKYHATRAL